MNEQLNNFLLLAETAQQGGNNEEALNYYNKILEIDPTIAKAWKGKGIAILNSSKIGDIKSSEAIAYFRNAITNNLDEQGVKEIVNFILSFSDGCFVGITNHYLQFKDVPNAPYDYDNRFSRILNLLDYADQLQPENNQLYKRGIGLTNLFLKHNTRGNIHYAVTNKYNYYVAKMKEIDPSFTHTRDSPGCFIATAATGNYNHPDVLRLRIFRDDYLINKNWGQKFINFYYAHSPLYAEKIRDNRFAAKAIDLIIIKPIVKITTLFTKKQDNFIL